GVRAAGAALALEARAQLRHHGVVHRGRLRPRRNAHVAEKLQHDLGRDAELLGDLVYAHNLLHHLSIETSATPLPARPPADPAIPLSPRPAAPRPAPPARRP